MGIIVVDNKNIKQHFRKIAESTITQQIKKIIIESKSGKGKTSLLKYFIQKYGQNVPCIYFDFKTESFDSAFDFIEQIMYSLTKVYNEIDFSSYESFLQKYVERGNNEVIIKNIEIIQSYIGNITVPNDVAPRMIHKAVTAFWKDYQSVLKDKKIVLLLDSFEQAPDTICNCIARYFLRETLKDNQLYIIIAGQEGAFSRCALDSDDIEKYSLPDSYSLEEWHKFGKQIHITDKNYVNRCFDYYDGEPFYMCIALKPQGVFDDK